MIKEIQKTNPQGKDLIDQIADALPPEIQAVYYREMRHLRSLPENDEMLRILRAIMFLTLLTEQVPKRVLTEREHLERICSDFLTTAKGLAATGSEYYRQLDKHLKQLPVDISTGISPKEIVERINDVLRRQFDMSTIPIVARELASHASTIRTATKQYTQATDELCASWRSASDKAHKAISDINNAISGTAKTAKEAIEELRISFGEKHYWMLAIVGSSAFVAGALFGLMITHL